MKYVKASNLPQYFPVTGTVALGLLIDRLGLPGWVWGVYGTIALMIAGCAFWQRFRGEEVDIFKEDKK